MLSPILVDQKTLDAVFDNSIRLVFRFYFEYSYFLNGVDKDKVIFKSYLPYEVKAVHKSDGDLVAPAQRVFEVMFMREGAEVT